MKLLNLCRSQIGILCGRFRAQGARGLIHGLRGKPSNRQLDPTILERALAVLRGPLYVGFGPTFANEKLRLKPHYLVLSTPVLRQGMINAGLWKAHRKGSRHRAWRARRDCVGMLVQLDGSDHDWFEGRGPRCVLMVYIDDATSRILYAEFVDVEDTLTLLRTTRSYLRSHGRPIAFYVDKDSIYKVNRQATIDEELKDMHPITQYTRAMNALDIEVICADTPQAKGRVERGFDTHQDRLVKELRLAGISTKEAANRFLWGVYLDAHNDHFAIAPVSEVDAHRPLRTLANHLDEILSIQTERQLANDFTLRFQNHYFQILPHKPLRIRPKNKVLFEFRLDGSTHIRFKGVYLPFKAIAKPPAKTRRLAKLLAELRPDRAPYRPPATHPWRTYKNPTLQQVGAHV
ncbi:MAG: ISNCY family transposase [Acidobacteriota bacterium]|nr:ISNCY family transposase [Acidobacteriota bacterium]